jgi:hypothetical protein
MILNLFNLTNPSSRIMAPRLTQPLTKINTRNVPKGKPWPARKAENITARCELIV